MINSDRLWSRLKELGEIGKEESGGVTRFSFTKEECAAKKCIKSYMIEAGMTVMEDDAGNVIGRFEGRDSTAPAVVIGSHIDSVKQGGIFDGALGVIAGIEVIQTMNEQQLIPANSIEVIAFSDEEGSRFNFGMIGSRAFAGTFDLSELNRMDSDGKTMKDAMIHAGYNPNNIPSVKREPKSIKCYLEIHIEQGRVLETKDLSVGIVTGIAGPLWMKWNITGESGHAGATPMDMRYDPMIAFAEIITEINKEVTAEATTVVTIGKVEVKPGGVNVIPKEVEFTIDLRDIDEIVRDKVERSIKKSAKEICEQYQLTLDLTTLQRVKPLLCSDEVQQIIEESCAELNVATTKLPSGAGHDGMQLGEVCPVGMIFVRSKNGISHNPQEYSSKYDCAQGTNVLYETVLKLAQ